MTAKHDQMVRIFAQVVLIIFDRFNIDDTHCIICLSFFTNLKCIKLALQQIILKNRQFIYLKFVLAYLNYQKLLHILRDVYNYLQIIYKIKILFNNEFQAITILMLMFKDTEDVGNIWLIASEDND